MPLSPQSASTQDEERQLIHLQKDILRATLSQGNVRDTVEHICRLAEPLLPESVATVLLLNDEGRLDIFAAPNVPAEALPHLSGLQLGPETGSCGNAVLRQEPVFVADTLSDNRWRQLRSLALDFGIMACWSMPIRDSQDRVIGSFALLSFVHRSPSPFHVQVLENLASAVSLVLERQRLQEQEQLQTKTLEAISEGILITGADERIRYVNSAFTHITGYSLDDMRGQYCIVLQGVGTDASTKARIRAALSRGESFHGDILNFRKDGSPFWNELNISPVHDRDGTITHFVSVQRDVSTRKTAAREQRIAAKAFEVQEGIMITDSQTHIIRVNEAFCHITGYSPEEVLGQTPAILHSGLQDPDFYRTMWDAVTRDGFWRGEILNRRKNGETYPELLTISAVHDDESGDVQYVGYFTELTEQKRLGAELQQSLAHQQRLTQFNILLGEVNQTIARAEDERSLLHDLCNLIVHYTDIRLAWIGKPNNLGMAQALAAAGEIGYLQGIHISTRADIPEGQGPFGRAWRDEKAVYDTNIRSDPTMRPWRETYLRFGMGFSSTLPIFRGGAIWAILGVNQGPEQPFETDERGILDEMARDIGFGLDRLDIIAREHEAQAFNEALLNNLTSGVEVIRYPDRIIERVNDRMLGLFGASFAEDLTGHSSREIYPNTETFQRVGEFVETVLAQGSGMLCDVPHRRLDGTPIYIDLSGHKLPTKAGEPERIVWTLVDVTERNRLTEELSRKSTTDPLTHLPNRRALETEMDRAMDRAQRNKKLMAVCMLDLDAFKPVNDSDYSPLDQELPTGLFGFYAGALSFHSSIKKMLMTNPSEINSEVLSDPRHCRWHGVLLRLGYGDDSPLQRIHNDYHRVLGTAARNATQNIRSIEWKMIDESLEVFLEAILSEWQKTR
ncbi:PAS domain-containing protein [Acidithiobacillus ferrooxidans]|uniref:PAS domain-containing protein n=1 Tax=Acidithiobacillus ferrooxidans TaxID=920 RepID=UPI00214C265D|nr:PAS domain-containing protein [Acidithiobacillus ferrooxidans]MCR2832035.1 PAS domain-containing protein [Acidithiobacillus ferrooxidans]